MNISALETRSPGLIPALTVLWNAGLGHALPLSERLVRFNLEQPAGAETALALAASDTGQAVGFVLARTITQADTGLDRSTGWIDALVVTPEAREQGAGGALLAWAEAWLIDRGCRRARLGGGPRPFAPGLPSQGGDLDFFLNRGFALRAEDGTVWDLARSLSDYATPDFIRVAQPDVRPLEAGQAPEMAAFLEREFPGRWLYEFQEHLRQHGDASDFLALWLEGKIQGFCQVTLESSLRPLERFYLGSLPRPWGQLGPIGVSAAVRGRGLGEALLDAGLRHLSGLGVDGCVIDWVARPAFYQKFGFHLHTEYKILARQLVSHA